VHLGGAAAEQGGSVEGEAGVLAGVGWDLPGSVFGRQFVQEAWRGSDFFGRWTTEAVLIVAGELVEGDQPAVAFVFDEALEHGEGGGFGGSWEGGFDLAEEGCGVGKVCDLSEETADLGVWIFAGLEAAEELQNELAVVQDGGVGLLGRAGTGGQRTGGTDGGEGGGFVAVERKTRG
jgi:hypothetical protein